MRKHLIAAVLASLAGVAGIAGAAQADVLILVENESPPMIVCSIDAEDSLDSREQSTSGAFPQFIANRATGRMAKEQNILLGIV